MGAEVVSIIQLRARSSPFSIIGVPIICMKRLNDESGLRSI